MELRDRRVLVTGASRGLGESLARDFAEAGADVIVVARSIEPLEKLAAAVGGHAIAADLGDAAQVRGLLDRAEAEVGPVDVLVNNAGIDLVGEFATTEPDDLEQIYNLNLLAPVLLCRAAIPRFLARGGGHIVNMSSMAGVGAFPGLTAYSSTKAGLTHFTAGLRVELHGLPIGLTVVEVGPFPTDMRDAVYAYEPTGKSFARFAQLHLMVEVDREKLALDIVDAVRRNRRHVRHPKRALAFPLLTETPRRIVEVLLTGVPRRAQT